MERGELIPERIVIDALLGVIFGPTDDAAGLIVDGFPRTDFQVRIPALVIWEDRESTIVKLRNVPDVCGLFCSGGFD